MDSSVFTYTNFSVSPDQKTVLFGFTSQKNEDTFSFTEKFVFDIALPDTLETYRLLRALHLASGISYYKIFVNTDIEHPYAMSTSEAAFWNNVFANGLGEFLFVNKLDPDSLATFGPQEGHDTHTTERIMFEQKALLGIGGGKDSIVAGELLKALQIPVTGFVMATGEVAGQAEHVAKVMKIGMHRVERSLDKTLIALQERPDAFKGHIPISLLFALVGSLLAVATKSSYVVVANESSASIPRAAWQGNAVNHQWSKSFEFEVLLQQYMSQHVSKDLVYFSAIRPLSSVAVAKLFSKYPQYFEVFTSDNYVFRIDAASRPAARWSLQSPKSLSSFILMSAWLNEETLLGIFEHNFLNEESLKEMFLQLLGVEGDQPLDCVGTPEELRSSLQQAYTNNTFKDSLLMNVAKSFDIVSNENNPQKPIEKLLNLSPEHAFATQLSPLLFQQIQKELA